MSSILDGLNFEQKEAVMHINGPLLIVAGAGTGKTTVITKKIAYVIEQGLAKPDEILALTFTDKAAGEMEERVDRLLPYGYVDLWISTFHAFCEKVLKNHGIEIGLPEFKLLTETEQWIMMRKNIDKFNLDYYRPMGNPTKFLRALLTHFSRAKDETISPEEYLEHAKSLKLDGDTPPSNFPLNKKGECGVADEKKKIGEIAESYHVYNQLLLEQGALDFGDLINYTLKIFKTRPKILEEYRNKFKYILVDEFQDTNFAQYELVKLLAKPKNNLTVVGDDDQSIYRFRGASMSNILTFDNDFSGSKKIILIQNYRSGQNILDASYKFISLNNPNRLEIKLGENFSKKLKANIETAGEVGLIEEAGLEEEVGAVMRKILDLKNAEKNISWNDFVILVRANESAKPFIHEAEVLGIPYQFLASRGLYFKDVVSWIISFLKLLDNYMESPAMFKYLQMPVWGVSPYNIADISYQARKNSLSLHQACEKIEIYSKDEAVVKSIKNALSLVCELRELAKIKKPSQVIYKFLEKSGLLNYLASKPDSKEKSNNFSYINKFYKKIKEFERNNEGAQIRDFVEAINLELEAGEQGALPFDPDEGPEMIKISTVHAAKGLEFKYVFVANLVDKRFPSIERSEAIEMPKELVKEILSEGDIHLEEERRLFYVAMTRAKEKLFLTWAKDYGGARLKKPSRFLYELGLVEEKKPNPSVIPAQAGISSQLVMELDEQFKCSIPKQFSYSQIKAYETCPYQYKLRFILNIPTEDSFQASFGRSIHNTLNKFFIKIKEGAGKSQASFLENAGQNNFPELKELEEIFEREWIGEWYESQEEMLKNKERGWKSLKIYYEKLKSAPPKPLYLEQEFIIKFDDNSFKGVIDRIDDLGNGAVCIIDYKTGAAPKNGKLDSDNKEQLFIYFLAARDILNLMPKNLTLNFIMDGIEIPFEPKESDLAKIKEKILGIIENIKGLNFEPNPSEHNCQYCDYNAICEFRK